MIIDHGKVVYAEKEPGREVTVSWSQVVRRGKEAYTKQELTSMCDLGIRCASHPCQTVIDRLEVHLHTTNWGDRVSNRHDVLEREDQHATS